MLSIGIFLIPYGFEMNNIRWICTGSKSCYKIIDRFVFKTSFVEPGLKILLAKKLS